MEVREILTDIGYELKDCGQYYRAKAIYRNANNPTSLSIHKATGRWTDYAIGATGRLEDLVKITLNFSSISEAKTWLEKQGVDISSKKQERPTLKSPKIYPNEILNELLDDHSYWIKRRISETTLRFFKGGIATKGQLAGRYVFPIFNLRKEIVGFTGRDTYNNIPGRAKWKHQGPKLEWIYPLCFHHEDILPNSKIILLESIGDMLSLWECGLTNILVLFGVTLGPWRLTELLKLNPAEIIIATNNDFDSDENHGMEAAQKIEKSLSNHFDKQQIKICLPTKKDFGGMAKDEILEWYDRSS